MNKFIGIVTLMVSAQLMAQIPAGYYNTATGSGYTLKTQLHNIIKDHNVLSYTPGLWNLYSNGTAWLDNWYENNGTILDVYSEKPQGTDSYEYTPIDDQCGNVGVEGTCYNREHLIPQSVFDSNSPMVSDAFHIWPTDGKVNGMRSNYPFGQVNSPTWTSTNGSKLGNNLNSGYSAGYSGIVFEPIDEFKGDIARAYFYFATRYESEGVASWSFDMFNGTDNQVFTTVFKNILLTWNSLDAVSSREIAINNSIYAQQGNRNPFIDHPEWVTSIWGTVVGVEEESISFCRIYPNPAQDFITIESVDEAHIETYEIYSLLGERIQSGNLEHNTQISIENISTGIYWLQVRSNTATAVERIVIQ